MAKSNQHPKDLLSKIQGDYHAAVAQQLLIPAAVTSAVISKRALGIFDRQDQLQLSSELISTLNYLSEHDYFAYLVFINRVDLIQKIFFQKDLFAKQLALIDELEHQQEQEYRHKNSNDTTTVFLFKKQQQQLAIQEQEREQRLRDEKVLLNMELYTYYAEFKVEIYNEFYSKQIVIINNAYQGRIERINRAVNLANSDPSVSNEDRDALIALQDSYQAEHQAAERMSIHKADGSIDPSALKKKADTLKEIEDRYIPQFAALLAKLDDHPQFRQIQQEETAAVQAYKQELIRNKEVLDERLAEIEPFLEQTRQVAKQDLESHMKDTIECLINKCGLDGFSEEQKGAVKSSVKILNTYKLALSETNDDAQIKIITAQFTEELIRLKAIINPIMNPEARKGLDEQIRLLSEITQQFNSNSAQLTLPAEQQPPVYAQAVSMASSVSSLAVGSSFSAPPPSYSDVVAEDAPPAYEASQSSLATSLFKERMSALVNRSQQSDINLKELDEEQQAMVDAFISMLPDTLNGIREESGFTAEEETLVSQLETLCKDVEPTIREAVDTSKIKQIEELMKQLKVNHSEFKDSWEQFESIVESFDDNVPRFVM